LNYVDQSVIFVVKSVLGLLTSSEEGSRLAYGTYNFIVPTVFMKMGNVLLNAADSNQHNTQ